MVRVYVKVKDKSFDMASTKFEANYIFLLRLDPLYGEVYNGVVELHW